MQWRKPPPELVDVLDQAISAYPLAERRQMFGMPAAFLNGNMFVGIHEDRIIVRLPEDDRREIQALYDDVIPFEPAEGRVMKEYVALPESIYRQPDVLKQWRATQRAWDPHWTRSGTRRLRRSVEERCQSCLVGCTSR